MSTSPERTSDRLVNHLSQWLAGHIGTQDLRRLLVETGTATLDPDGAEAVEELIAEIPGASRAELQKHVREAIETLALG